jgi:uncharacterized protein YqgC (DUF456 family)
MDELVYILYSVGTLVFAGLGVILIPFGLPGNWLIALVGLCGPLMGLGWLPMIVLLVAAAVAEILELVSATKITKKAGAGKAGMWGCFFGGIAGAILCTPFLPIPIIGTLIGSALGAFAGAVVFEVVFASKESRALLDIGTGAFLGVLLGKVLKMAIGGFQVAYWCLVVIRGL